MEPPARADTFTLTRECPMKGVVNHLKGCGCYVLTAVDGQNILVIETGICDRHIRAAAEELRHMQTEQAAQYFMRWEETDGEDPNAFVTYPKEPS